jgi:predicted RNase H-like HicB family nuclease
MKFAIAIEPGTKTTAFGVVVPDLPGCFSAGDTAEDAYDNAREAIETHCELLIEQGKDLPSPRPLAEWMKDREFNGWMWGIVDAPVEKLLGPAEKINITVPERLLRKIDAAATAAGEGRSGFLVSAAMRRIADKSHLPRRSKASRRRA